MNRRNFLSLAALAVAGQAAQRVWPFRVYSIPKEIVLTPHPFDPHFLIGFDSYFRLGDTVGIYDGPIDFLRGTARVEKIQNGVITLDHVPTGCVPGDKIAPWPRPGEFLNLTRS